MSTTETLLERVKKSSEPLAVYDCSDAEYHAIFKFSKSRAQKIVEKWVVTYALKDVTVTDSMRMGSMLHKIVLEPDKFNDSYVEFPGFAIHTKKGQALFDEWLVNVIGTDVKRPDYVKNKTALSDWFLEEFGKELYSSTDFAIISEQVKAIMNHPVAAEWLKRCDTEVAIFAELHGLQIKGKLDAVDKHRGFALDLKRDVDAHPDRFVKWERFDQKAVEAAIYVDLAREAGILDFDDFRYIAVEPEWPYKVYCHSMSKDAIQHGRELYEKAIDLWKHYEKTGRDTFDDDYRLNDVNYID